MLPSIDLTVGHVAGIIAAGIVIAQIISPTIVTFILAGVLRDTETASTWTVASSTLQASLWPTLLRSDSTGNGGRVRRLIKFVSLALPVTALVIAIAGVVTPLGLGQEIVRLEKTRGTFEYLQDDGPYYYGTSKRGEHDFSRLCDQGPGMLAGPAACPFSNTVINKTESNGTTTWDLPNGYNDSVPNIVREIFSSGTKGKHSTISNFFDIEWRQLSSRIGELVNDGKTPYSVGMYRQLDSFILDPEYKLIEGLVVDAKMGGIGFRNHTTPINLDHGATWMEDLLFIEPDTVCVNTNITLDFEITTDGGIINNVNLTGGMYENLRFTDRGGFHGINKTYPYPDFSDPQANPDLWGRAYKAAWLHNMETMFYMNITHPNVPDLNMTALSYLESKEGQAFHLNLSSAYNDYRSLEWTDKFGANLDVPGNNSFDLEDGTYDAWPNPWNVTTADFDRINILAGGAGNVDIANISLIYVGSGLLRAAPLRQNDGPPSLFDQDSRWQSNMLACAAALRATVKTVSFTMNGTHHLSNLKVNSIETKIYAKKEDQPLWGMEDFGMEIGGYSPAWGLISEEYRSRENISSRRSPHLYLPGYAGSSAITPGSEMFDNFPASSFAVRAMNSVLGMSSSLSASDWKFDLRGAGSMALFRRWQELSSDPKTASQILNLMWTDVAASAVVGTKGVLGEMNAGEDSVPIDISPYGRRITYDLRFGIPAFLLAVTIAFIFATALLTTCLGKSSLARMRLRLAQLSVGRVFTTFLYPQSSNLTMPSEDWRDQNGRKEVLVGAVAQRGQTSEVYDLGSRPFPYGVEAQGLVGGGKDGYHPGQL